MDTGKGISEGGEKTIIEKPRKRRNSINFPKEGNVEGGVVTGANNHN